MTEIDSDNISYQLLDIECNILYTDSLKMKQYSKYL